jgi:biopolymer transport protein ExbB/TolQ
MNQPAAKPPVLERVIEWMGSTSSLVVHTLLFVVSFSLVLFGVSLDQVLLVVTTVVSLEAIYMSIFIQMAVNRNTHSLVEVVEDVNEIQEDVDEIQKDVDVIQEDIDEIQEDVDEIQEDVDDMEKDDNQHLVHGEKTQAALSGIERDLQKLIEEIAAIKNERK